MFMKESKEKRNSEKPDKSDRGDGKKRHGSMSTAKDSKGKEPKEEVPTAIPAAVTAPEKTNSQKGKEEPKRRGTDADNNKNKYVGEIPPPRTDDFHFKMEDLPPDAKRLLDSKTLNFDKALVEKYFHHFWTIARFLMPEAFAGIKAPERPKKDGDSKDSDDKPAEKGVKRPHFSVKHRPYALASQIEDAKKMVQVSEKPVKKLYKGNEKAGEGGFGEVFVAKDTTSKSGKDKVAVKRISHDTAKAQENNWTEIAFLSHSKHPNIVEFKKAFLVKDDKKGPEEIWIIMEYLEGGTLGQAAAANALSEDHIAYVAHEMLAVPALKYLHEKQWVHRDLKSANVMMSIKGEIKLIDFGLCADFSEGPRLQMLGSPYWIPPEMTWGHPHSYPADVWSMGVCILELMLCHPPHNDNNVKGMFYVCTKGLTDQIPSRATVAAKGFLARCLILDPEKRPPVEDLLKDPWVARPNLSKGIDEVLKQVFLSASFSTLGF